MNAVAVQMVIASDVRRAPAFWYCLIAIVAFPFPLCTLRRKSRACAAIALQRPGFQIKGG